MTLVVLFEDEALLAVDKPSGMLVHRGIGRDDVVLVDLVREHTHDTPRPIHRLDRGTSGVVLFARSAVIATSLQTALTTGEITKAYLALVRGVAPESGLIDHPVPRGEGLERVLATTRFELRETFDVLPRSLSLVRAWPRTGRFHQIRRHLKHINHPIIGDANYGKGALNREIRERYGLGRLALHAEQLDLNHPITGAPLVLRAPLPESLGGPLDAMRSWTSDDG